MNAQTGAIALALATGFVVEMPVGPVSALCIRQAIVLGPVAGLVTGLAPALADSIYGALGIVGSRVPLAFLAPHRVAVHVAIGLLLCGLALYFAVSAWRGPHVDEPSAAALARGVAPTLVLAFANPAALVVSGAIFTGVGVGTLHAGDYPLVVAAMFVGAMAWWSVVAAVAARVRKRATAGVMRAIYGTCGLVFFAAGIVSLAGAR